MTTRAEILKETREWLGTPYKHQHAQKGLGTDCLGLLIGVHKAVIGTPTEEIPAYSQSWDEAAQREDMLAAADKYLVKREDGLMEPGDVLVFRIKPGMVAKHCAIVTEPQRMIHAYQGLFVSEVYIVPWWKSRIAGVYKFPGVE